ncbi:hypothetical protein CRM22_007021 [Opisthorchis felineus]|uniref:MD-2-related lipid-recognition domain-containing protein n=1 Tax=Opisthorchis felineus TaxID=147828 RepID=A0A4S2LQP6_OPIFE|nr:hypothetical protein CRM22_007021 [Opisthorchis felineus]
MRHFNLFLCGVVFHVWDITKAVDFTDCATNINAGAVKVGGGFNSKTMAIPLPRSGVCKHLTPPCPVLEGVSYTYSYTGIVPGAIPPGLLNIRWKLLDTTRRSFVCVAFQAKFV